MKKGNSKVLKVLIALSFVFGLFFLTPDPIKEVQAEVGPCALYGTHKMHAQSTATVKYKGTNKNAIAVGTMFECNCGSSIVVTGHPPAGPLYDYATDPTPVFGVAGHVSYETPKSNVRYTTNYSLPGYRFF